jgi:hypothetical protein
MDSHHHYRIKPRCHNVKTHQDLHCLNDVSFLSFVQGRICVPNALVILRIKSANHKAVSCLWV